MAAGPSLRHDPWAPLRRRTYRSLWSAQLASNVGTWMQNVAAAWYMGDLHGSPSQVALVQTATSLPVFFVAITAGALADIVDRRRLLLATQSWMLAVTALLAIASALDAMSPASLLGATFALGLGAALNLPAWQAIQPELVPREELSRAVSLGAMSMSLGRSVGPAIGGLVLAAWSPAAVFGLNAASFVGVLVALRGWERPRPADELPPERLRSALRAGVRYANHSPALRAVLVRTTMFGLPACAVMALLPVIARSNLHLGPFGYGVLFACIGIGAVLSSTVVARAQANGVDRVINAAAALVAAALVAMATLRNAVLLAPFLFIGGAGWAAGVATLNVSTQSVLPAWVRARGMSLYVLVMQGGIAIGAAAWGALAEHSTALALAVPAGMLLLGVGAARRWPLHREQHLDLQATAYWPEPAVAMDVDPDRGPVLITVEYRVRPDEQRPFVTAMRKVQRVRRRTGAYRWGLYVDASDTTRIVETFMVESWEEHLRQHQRTTATDQRIQEAAAQFVAPGSSVRTSHLLWAY